MLNGIYTVGWVPTRIIHREREREKREGHEMILCCGVWSQLSAVG